MYFCQWLLLQMGYCFKICMVKGMNSGVSFPGLASSFPQISCVTLR